MAAKPENNAVEQDLTIRRMEVFSDTRTEEESENDTVGENEYIEVHYYTNDDSDSGTTLVIQIPAYIFQPIEKGPSRLESSKSESATPRPSNSTFDESGLTTQTSTTPESSNLMLNTPSSSKNSPIISVSNTAMLSSSESTMQASSVSGSNNLIFNKSAPNNNQPDSSEQAGAVAVQSDMILSEPGPNDETINQLVSKKQSPTMPERSNQMLNKLGSNNYSQPGSSKQAPINPSSGTLMLNKYEPRHQILSQPGTSKQGALPRLSVQMNELNSSEQRPMSGPSHGFKKPMPSSQEPRKNRVPRMPVTADYNPSNDDAIETPRPAGRSVPAEKSEPEPERRTRVTYCFCRKQGDLDRFARAKRKREEMLARRPPPTPRFILTCRGYEHGVQAILSSCVNSSEDRIASDLRTFEVAERFYTVLDKSVAAMIFGISRYQKMLRKRKFTLVTDQPVFVRIFDRATLHQTVPQKWQRVAFVLSLFDYDIIYKPRPPKRNYVRPFLPFYFY